MRALVTGGTGVVGAAVCRHLLDAGDEVIAYDIAMGGALTKHLGSERAAAITIRADVSDAHHVLRTVKDQRVDTIIHMASLLALESDADPPRAVRVNCGGMINVLEAARLLGIERVV